MKKLKVQGCHNCPFHVEDTGAYFLCRHPHLRMARQGDPPTKREFERFRQGAREFNSALSAAERRYTYDCGDMVLNDPTEDRPGYPSACPLLGVPLELELET